MLVRFDTETQAVQIDWKKGEQRPIAFEAGEVAQVKRTKQNQRTLNKLASYWCTLKDFVDNMPEHITEAFYKHLLTDLMIYGSIDTELLHELLKRIYGIESVAFENLDENSMNKYHNFVKETTARWLEK